MDGDVGSKKTGVIWDFGRNALVRQQPLFICMYIWYNIPTARSNTRPEYN